MSLLSHWLARHVGDADLRHELDRIDTGGLGVESTELLAALRVELEESRARGDLERLVRETLEALALGL